ncbi:hypothetical protein [uncultured Microbulbifer sp.]|uniref:hypothetical protein n=1 Tax=uncultured Microbulbifer sp. TaxID=348147 RepID=UPI00260595E3|nr:hypothetical protein [uncultured Microbulbifer sp.]
MKFKMDGLMMLVLLVLAGAFILWRNRNAFNPLSEDNLAHQGAEALVGEDRLDNFFNHWFAGSELAIEWFTPFGDGDTTYAESVWFGTGE